MLRKYSGYSTFRKRSEQLRCDVIVQECVGRVDIDTPLYFLEKKSIAVARIGKSMAAARGVEQ
jgi:hypothetical protein